MKKLFQPKNYPLLDLKDDDPTSPRKAVQLKEGRIIFFLFFLFILNMLMQYLLYAN